MEVDLSTAGAALDSPFDFEGLPPELQRLHIVNSEASEKVRAPPVAKLPRASKLGD